MKLALIHGFTIEHDLDLVGGENARVVARQHAADQAGRDEGGTRDALDEGLVARGVEEAVVELARQVDELKIVSEDRDQLVLEMAKKNAILAKVNMFYNTMKNLEETLEDYYDVN